MKRKRTLSLAAKWLLFQAIGLTLVIGVVGLVQYRSIRESVYEDVRSSGEAVIQVFRELLSEHPQLFNSKSLGPVIIRFNERIPDLDEIVIVDRSMRIIAHTNSREVGKVSEQPGFARLLQGAEERVEAIVGEPDDHHDWHLVLPIEGRYDEQQQSNIVGAISLDMHLTQAEQRISEAFTRTMLLMGSLLALLWVATYVLFRRSVLGRLQQFTNAATRFGRGDYVARVPVASGDEFGRLAETFNSMAEDVAASNLVLQDEIQERQRAEAVVKAREEQLAEAQRIAHVGNWEWDILTGEVFWSDEMYRIYGVDPQEFEPSYEGFLNCIHPDDRQSVAQLIGEALATCEFPSFDHRTLRPDGTSLFVHSEGNVIVDEQGRPVKMMGIGQDITAHREMDAAAATLALTAEPPVNLKHFHHAVGEDDEAMEALDLYLSETAEAIKKLSAAAESGDAATLYRLAHNSAGSSALCGMKTLTPLVREMEQLGRAGVTEGAQPLIELCAAELERVKLFLAVEPGKTLPEAVES